MVKITRALISVTDKKGIVEFAKGLSAFGVEIISTGGTAKALKDAGLKVTDISEFTGFPEMMDGRVKTLHPKVHGAILAVRDNESHVKSAKEHNIKFIDMVVVNLYQFEATVAKEGVSREEAIENIDIGGPSMIRSAAKNNKYVAVVTNPSRYKEILDEMSRSGGSLSEETLFSLAQEAFSLTAHYDTAIANYLEKLPGKEFPAKLCLEFDLASPLRYGENPHQKAAFYRAPEQFEASISTGKFLSGKELSYNNIMDADCALELVKSFDEIAVAIIKHANPCGCAVAETLKEAFIKAYECDPVSAFGSIVAANRRLDAKTAKEMATQEKFIEVIIAPEFEDEAVKILTTQTKWGKNVRLLSVGALPVPREPSRREYDLRKVVGGILIQERDLEIFNPENIRIVTKREPTEREIKELEFALHIAKFVKSNAIVLSKDFASVGVGAGQMSRVDSTKIAVEKAGEKAKGAVLASDAFFPFPDSIEVAAQAGVTAIIQPGGSLKDDAAIEMANRYNLAMVFTGMRHFRH
jgi:phosphoribosylaminoimidazolecarboxamide formyltransferase/IMP cyclohydrolase